jgi:uncharacterized damage-inducible protein DinB
MSRSCLEPAFAHHVWATQRLIDACFDLSAEELETRVPGTRGPMLETLRHVVGGDADDLFILTGDRAYHVDAERMSLAEARVVMERNGSGWAKLISGSLDPDAVVREIDETDGYQRWAPVGFRLAASLNHGADHRSQICTALTTLGVDPPGIDVYNFGLDAGRVVEKMPGVAPVTIEFQERRGDRDNDQSPRSPPALSTRRRRELVRTRTPQVRQSGSTLVTGGALR